MADPSSSRLRLEAAKNLGYLIPIQTRIEPLIVELSNLFKTSLSSPESDVGTIALAALTSILRNSQSELSATSRQNFEQVLNAGIESNNETLETSMASLFGELVKNLPEKEAIAFSQ